MYELLRANLRADHDVSSILKEQCVPEGRALETLTTLLFVYHWCRNHVNLNKPAALYTEYVREPCYSYFTRNPMINNDLGSAASIAHTL